MVFLLTVVAVLSLGGLVMVLSASSELGVDGTVEVNAPNSEVTGTVEPLTTA